MLSESENYAYIAGLLDGEGCFYAETRKYVISLPSVYISNTNKRVLEWVQEVLGYGRLENHSPNNPKYRQGYRLIFGANNLRKLLPKIIPYLKIKRLQAIFLKEILLIKERQNNTGKIGRYSPEEKQWLLDLGWGVTYFNDRKNEHCDIVGIGE